MSIAADAQHLFDRAEGIFTHCKSRRSHNFATMLYLRASDLLEHVVHPLDYMKLVIRQTDMLVTHVVPKLLAA